ncbi:MAG: RadC family protein [Verrucomicrobiales bacterium]
MREITDESQPGAPLPKATPRLRELPANDLPREKFERSGPSALSDAELLALFFGTGAQGLNVIEMSRQLLGAYGSLVDLSRLTWVDFMKVRGIGEAKAKHLAAAFELGKRLAHQTYSQQSLETPNLIYELVGPDMRARARESIRVVLLNTRLRLLNIEEIALGTINECMARPLEILRPAIVQQAYAFVVVHNHPSGDTTPSSADRSLTRRLKEAADLLQVRFFDHVIVGQPAQPGGQPFFSFREAGML